VDALKLLSFRHYKCHSPLARTELLKARARRIRDIENMAAGGSKPPCGRRTATAAN
jgi:hypothetical protein